MSFCALRSCHSHMDDSFLKTRINKRLIFNSNNKRKDCHPYLLNEVKNLLFMLRINSVKNLIIIAQCKLRDEVMPDAVA